MVKRDDRSYLDVEDYSCFPGNIYRQVILEPHFDESKNQLFQYMMMINRAHGLMLSEEKIINSQEMQKILRGLDTMEIEIDWQAVKYNPMYEDLFFLIESELGKRVGIKLAGQLHTGRSRNDMDATLSRMAIREKVLRLSDQLIDFRRSLLNLTQDNINTIMLAYTHTQQAQPITLGHYFIAVIHILERDFQRIQEYYQRLNLSPMGAGALATTSFPINRESVAKYLGFDDILENSYDCISSSDYLSEASTTVVIMMTNISRILHDFLLYVMAEFNHIRISDAYVQISSIMPQKRNPVSLEHARSLATGILGQTQIVTTMLINTPFGDIVDKENELNQHLLAAMERAIELFRLLTVVFSSLEVNRELLLSKVEESYAVITQLAEEIVQQTELSFRTAHQIVSKVAREALAEKKKVTQIDANLLNQASLKIIGKSLNFTDQLIQRSLNPQRFIELRTITGGPAPRETERQINLAMIKLKKDEGWVDEKWEQLANSQKLMQIKIDALINQSFLLSR